MFFNHIRLGIKFQGVPFMPFLSTRLALRFRAQAFGFWFLAAFITAGGPIGVAAILPKLFAQLLDFLLRQRLTVP